MSRVRETVTVVARSAFGLLWLGAAASKIAGPLVPYELVTHVAPPGDVAKAILAATVAGETLLGAAMLLGALRGFGLSIAALAAFTAVLLVVRAGASELVPCGCFGDVLGTTLDGAILRNVALMALAAALILWNRSGRPAATIR